MCSARGVEIRGNGNTLDSVRVFSNGLEGVSVLGNANVVTRSTIGDKAKGNGASGVSLAGTGNTVRSLSTRMRQEIQEISVEAPPRSPWFYVG